jgi:hypothetical protein
MKRAKVPKMIPAKQAFQASTSNSITEILT